MVIDRDDIEKLQHIFMLREECNAAMNEVNKKLANDNTQLALIKQQLKTISWVAKTTLASVIGLFAAYLFNLLH